MGSGDWYGITNYGEDIVMYYNTDMFDKYGIEIPTTLDELESAMQKFVDAGVTPLSEGVAEYPAAAPVVAAGTVQGRRFLRQGIRNV